MSDWKAERGRVAALTRSRAVDDPDLIEARRNLKAERLADYITRTVETAPPLSESQRERIAALLRPSGGARVPS